MSRVSNTAPLANCGSLSSCMHAMPHEQQFEKWWRLASLVSEEACVLGVREELASRGGIGKIEYMGGKKE